MNSRATAPSLVGSPAARAIAEQLRRRRPALPRALRIAFYAGLVLVGVYVALLAYFYATDRALFRDMLRLYGLTLLAGREPAMFAVYQPPTPVPLGWMMFVAVLDDVGTLLLTITWVWYAFERLNRSRWMDDWLTSMEKSALENRRWIRMWGLWGLALFYWLPGFGSGVLAICVIGVLARIPPARLVPVLVASAAAVALFWAVALHETSAALPRGPTQWLPVVVIAAVVALGLVSTLRQRRTRHILLLEWPAPPPDRLGALESLGIRPHGGIVEVDARTLAARGAFDENQRGRARAVGELLLLEAMTLEAARALEERGVDGVHDLALLEPGLVRDALREAGVALDGHAERWIRSANELVSGAGAAFAKPPRDEATEQALT